ncbi:hypothetical protein A1O3_01808 [Capronia epimyces CBS 606.96]|uniref:Uncharacterized protein n=1 Tax=Capronia epimyces CBS 606.96 TaxID=1182542 RepID=W9YVF1_9EURO|nr:uncharacterized protein A1O3_01808 [Capronia epimyces CBS 606.96]EXJ93251.1 hypothetical protein A1O3_01808 [Capronia epimyces CBS 606.96]
MVIDPRPTPSTNPLLWWLIVLVQSAMGPLQQYDCISRGQFQENILPMDIDVRTRVEAVQLYAKVLILNRAFRKWGPPNRDWILEVGNDLNMVDTMWLNEDTDQRPPEERDSRTCDSKAWLEMLDRLEVYSVKYLGGEDETVLAKALKLLQSVLPVKLVSLSVTYSAYLILPTLCGLFYIALYMLTSSVATYVESGDGLDRPDWFWCF